MGANFQHMAADIAYFALANALFMVALYYYRKSKGKRFRRLPEAVRHRLLKSPFMKLGFAFAATYFVFYILIQHTGIGCEDLDADAQCQCYALKLKEAEGAREQAHWARLGRGICGGSPYFQHFLDAQQ